MMRAIRHQHQVYVVDGDLRVANELACPLSAAGYQATCIDTAQAFLTAVDPDVSSCALLALDRLDQDGFEVLEQLRRMNLAIPIIFTTAHGEVATCVRAMRAGVIDFLVRPTDRVKLLDAVARAQAISMRWHAERAEEALAHELLATLTIRERQVLALVLDGRRNKEIATALSSQEATVKVHRSRLMRKLESRSLVELVRFRGYLCSPLAIEADPRRAQPVEIALTAAPPRHPMADFLRHYDTAPRGADARYAQAVTANPWADAAGTWSDFSWTHVDAEAAT